VTSHYTLTKKTFLAGAQCIKRMWWEMYEPAAEETRPSLATRFRMEEGVKVGVLARGYIPGGRLIRRGGRSLNAILAESREAIADPSAPAIYEGVKWSAGAFRSQVVTLILQTTRHTCVGAG